MDGLIGAPCGSHVVVGAEVDIQKSVARSIRAHEPGIILRPGDGRDTPFDCVSAKNEGASGGWRLGPRNAKLVYG